MIKIPFITNLYQKARDKNVLAGLVIIDLIAFISYMIFPAGIFYLGDLQMTIGCIIGTIFALKNIRSNQSFLIYGVIVGLGGTILTAISCSIFDWITLSAIEGFNLSYFLIILGFFFIEAIIIGLLIGGIIGSYYYFTHKTSIETSIKEEEFYKSLIDN